MLYCVSCGKELKKPNTRFCSNICQGDYSYVSYIHKWKQGKVSGLRGKLALNISRHIQRYLTEKYSSCSICGWDKLHPTTLRVPLEIDHIDGNFLNNKETNLRLICPNCHALSLNFRNLNRGKGREWRRLKYIKSI